MAHDVFVSHSSKDKPTADAVCAVLESQGIRCWVAPRDIIPGREWGASIVEAIKGAKVMVLIFSAHANSSPQINKEVERAINKGVPVIPMRIEDIVPTESLEYFLSSNHWLDAFSPPLEKHLQRLAQNVRQFIGGPAREVLPIPVAEHELREKAEAEKLAEEKRQLDQVKHQLEEQRRLMAAEKKKADEAATLAENRKKVEIAEAARLAEGKREAAETMEKTRRAEAERRAAEIVERERIAKVTAAEIARAAEEKRKAVEVAGDMPSTETKHKKPEASGAAASSKERNRRMAVAGSLLAIVITLLAWMFIQQEQQQAKTDALVAQAAKQQAAAQQPIIAEEQRAAKIEKEAADGIRTAQAKAGQERLAKPTDPYKILSVPDQYNTIQSAVDAANNGDTVQVKAGTYSESLLIRQKEIRLIGEGKDVVTVQVPAAQVKPALNCVGMKTGFISGITFEQDNAAGVMHFELDKSTGIGVGATTVPVVNFYEDGNAVEMADCRIQMGGGVGIGVNDCSPKITACVIQKNGSEGINVSGTNAAPGIIYNDIRVNGSEGIEFIGGAAGKTEKNVCENNGTYGIYEDSYVRETNSGPAPILEANLCRSNGASGIGLDAYVTMGDVEQNLCENNKKDGINIDSHVDNHAIIDFNICRDNLECGIDLYSAKNLKIGDNNQFGGNGAGDKMMPPH